jgi:hypothetical protein
MKVVVSYTEEEVTPRPWEGLAVIWTVSLAYLVRTLSQKLDVHRASTTVHRSHMPISSLI